MSSSVRFILNVSGPEKMNNVCEFYSNLLQNEGVPTIVNNVSTTMLCSDSKDQSYVNR